MEGIRSLLKKSLRQSIESLDDVDRLAVAWPVACGKAMAEHAFVVSYADGIVCLEAVDDAWMREMMNMKAHLAHEISRIAGVQVKEIRIAIKRDGK